MEKWRQFFDTAETAVPPRPETFGRSEEIGQLAKVSTTRKVTRDKTSRPIALLDWIRGARWHFDRSNMPASHRTIARRLQTDYVDL